MKQNGIDINILVNGITICYDDLGKSSTPLIFIHGFPFNKSTWKPQSDVFRKNMRVISYDIRGYGKSTGNNQKASISLFADDLIKFMDILDIDKAIVCGLSMGGYILLNAIDRYPERFEAVIFCDTQCISDTPEGKEKRNLSISKIIAGGLNEFTEGFIKNIFCSYSLENKKELVDNIRNIILSTSPETIIGTLTALAERHETCSVLNKISVPALIICGKEDIVTPPAQAEFLKKHIANSALHILDQAGHMSNIERSGEFNKLLIDFISNLGQK